MFTQEQAIIINQKIIEVKKVLDNEFLTYTSQDVSITISVLGNIKEIQNTKNKTMNNVIPIINEVTTKARQEYDVKQAQLLQKEMMNFM